MQKRRFFGTTAFVMFALAVGIGLSYPAAAEEASSAHYQLSETQFNSGSTLNGCSTEYCARVNIGDSSIGNSKSDGESSATFGSVTPDRPSLDVIVEPGVSNLGTLSTEATGAKTLVVKIRSYLSDGYVLQIRGAPPKYGNHTLKTSNTPVASIPGTEQFGINLTSNTTPNFGANPVQVPDETTSFGTVAANYNQPNKFMYINGDTVASSSRESGETDFTITMIVNVANNTPAGNYVGDYSAVVIPIY